MKVDLRGNIKTVGSVFATASISRNYDRRLVQRLVTVETDEPWRRGRGWGVLLAPRLIVGFGTWGVSDEPAAEVAREANEIAHDIPQWRKVFEISLPKEPVAPEGWTIVPLEHREDEVA